MDDKERLKNKLQETINELKNLSSIKEPILSNWNDEIAIKFNEKYKAIEKEIDTIIKGIEELQKLV